MLESVCRHRWAVGAPFGANSHRALAWVVVDSVADPHECEMSGDAKLAFSLARRLTLCFFSKNSLRGG